MNHHRWPLLPSHAMPSSPLHILLVSPSPADRAFVAEALRGRAGGTVAYAASVTEALQHLASGSFHAVLAEFETGSDVELAAFARLVMAARAIPVLAWTKNEDEQAASEAAHAGAHACLIQGDVSAAQLRRAIRFTVERHGAATTSVQDERLRLITDQLPAILWTTDRELRVTSSLGRGLESLGLRPDEITGQLLEDYLKASDAQSAAFHMHERALVGEEASGDVDFQGRRFHIHVRPLLKEDRIVGTIGVALDVTEQRRMEQNIEAARRIQRGLLPAADPDLRGFDIAGACYAADACSGDYFDYIPLGDRCLGVAVADVSGHGFGPAILASAVRSYLRASAALGKEPYEMLTITNCLLARDHASDHFATLFLAKLNPTTRSFTFASAGHVGFLMNRRGQTKVLRSTSIPLGIDLQTEFLSTAVIGFEPGDLLVLATDGAVETFRADGQQFGTERLLQTAFQHRQLSAAGIVDEIHRATLEFAAGAEQLDDVTAVVVKVLELDPDSSDDSTT